MDAIMSVNIDNAKRSIEEARGSVLLEEHTNRSFDELQIIEDVDKLLDDVAVKLLMLDG